MIRGERILRTFRLLLFHSGFIIFPFFTFCLILLVYCNLLMEENDFSFCSIKVLNIVIKRWLILTHVLYSRFCAEMTMSFRRKYYVLFSYSKTWFFNDFIHSVWDYSVFTFFANGRVRITTCTFLLGDLANS